MKNRSFLRNAGIVGTLILAGSTFVSAQTPEPEQVLSEADLVKSLQGPPPYDKGLIWRLVDLGDPSTLPALRTAYEQETDYSTKLVIASALVILEDPSPLYFSRLLEAGNRVLENSIPIRGGPDGETPEYRAVFEKWRRGKSEQEMQRLVQMAMSEDPGVMDILARTNDPRLSPLFRRGLASPNQLVIVSSAMALAAIQDTGAIPLMIAKCESSEQVAKAIAMTALVFFSDSPSAQAALVRYFPDAQFRQELVQAARERWARGFWK
jgi:HEAT repeat protein